MENNLPIFIALPLFTAFIMLVVNKLFRKEWLEDCLFVLTSGLLCFMALKYIPVIQNIGLINYKMGGWLPPFGINLVLDGLSLLLLVTISVISFLISIFSIKYIKLFTSKAKYYTLFLLMIVGMNGVVLTGDFFNLYVFLEIAAVASYILVAFGCEHEELEAAFKYMVLGSVASIIILFGIAILYSLTGSLNMADISQIISRGVAPPAPWLFVAALFFMGFGLKAGLVPFHAWLPDAHPSAPASISAMLSGLIIKALGIYAIARIFFNVFGLTPLYSSVIVGLGILSMIVGVLLALGQWDFKRLLAYHSISQMGYVMLGLGLGTPLGILGGLFHLANHAVFKSLLFLTSGAVEYNTGTRDLKKLGGINKVMPMTTTAAAVASFSISGIPPFNGFWSKLIIILAAFQAGKIGYGVVTVVVSFLTLASFLKIQRYIFFGETPNAFKKLKEVAWPMVLAMLVMAGLCLGMGLFAPQILNYVIKGAQEVLVGGTNYGMLVLGR